VDESIWLEILKKKVYFKKKIDVLNW
jgi:hypothetical protein